MNYEQIFSNLNYCGFSVQENALSIDFCQNLVAEVSGLTTKSAGVGANKELNSEIRQDKIKWLEGSEGRAISQYFREIEKLQTYLKEKTYLPLINFECHYAKYEQGGFYKPHYDNVQGKNNRLLTAILYLNDSWCSEHGGELVAHTQSERLTVEPKAGTFLIFDSTDLLHEVLPSHAMRQSITGWMTR